MSIFIYLVYILCVTDADTRESQSFILKEKYKFKDQSLNFDRNENFPNISNIKDKGQQNIGNFSFSLDATNFTKSHYVEDDVINGCIFQIDGYYYGMNISFCTYVLQIRCLIVDNPEIEGSGGEFSNESYDDVDQKDTQYNTTSCNDVFVTISGNQERIEPTRNGVNRTFYIKNSNNSAIVCVGNMVRPCLSEYDIDMNTKELFVFFDSSTSQEVNSNNLGNIVINIEEVDDQTWLSITSPILNETTALCTMEVNVMNKQKYTVAMIYNNKKTQIYSDVTLSSRNIPVGFMNEPFRLNIRMKIDGRMFVDGIKMVDCINKSIPNRTEIPSPVSDFQCDFEYGACTRWLNTHVNSRYCHFNVVTGLDSTIQEMSIEEDVLIGKFVDHSLRSYTGHFLYIKGKTFMSGCPDKKQAKISTAIFRIKEYADHKNSCKIKLSFKGNMKLMVIMKFENGTHLKNETEIRTSEWREITFLIPDTNLSFFIEILTEKSPSKWLFAAVDDVQFTDNCSLYVVEERPMNDNGHNIDVTKLNNVIIWSVVAVIAISIILVLFTVRRRMKVRRSRTHQTSFSDPVDWFKEHLSSPLLPNCVKKLGHFQNALTKKNPNYEWYSGRLLNFNIKDIPRDKLIFSESNKIGSGAFGEVFSGLLDYNSHKFEGRDIAIKRILQNSSEMTRMDFFLEALTLSKFSHVNIVECLGISVDKSSMMLVLELLPGGDLKTFLRNIQLESSDLTFQEKLDIIFDVGRGCQYLEELKFIHRDIAARNCLLTSKGKDRIVKLADFGLARDVMASEYYRKSGSALLPVRWMPPESFLDGYCSSKSDVWSYGVLIWEVFTYAQLPYSSYSNSDVLAFVRSGGRLEQPCACTQQLYNIMMTCWKHDYTDRPSFGEICRNIKTLHQVPKQEFQKRQKTYIKRKRQNTYIEEDIDYNHVTV